MKKGNIKGNTKHDYTYVKIELVHKQDYGLYKKEKIVGMHEVIGKTPGESDALYKQLLKVMMEVSQNGD